MDALNAPAIRALGFLDLLILADSTASIWVPVILGSSTLLEPGYWNLGAAAIFISTITELISQLVFGVLVDKKGKCYAIFLNISSILILSTCILLICTYVGEPSTTLELLFRTTIFFTSGAVMTLCQAAGSVITPQLLKHGKVLLCAISIMRCVLAYVLLVLDIRLDTSSPSPSPSPSSELSIEPSHQPFLNEPQASQEAQAEGFLVKASKFLVLNSILESWNLALLAAVFFTRRYGFLPDQASKIWLMRTIIAVALFSGLLPLAVYIQARKVGSSPSKITFLASKTSISLMGIGALMIGLARIGFVLIARLIVNSLGIANDLYLLEFAAEIMPEKIAGRIFMLIASLESLGTLLGVGILHPVYQWSMKKESLNAESACYICTALYALVASLFGI